MLIISPPQCYGHYCHMQAAITSYWWNHATQTTVWTNSSSVVLGECSHWMETGKQLSATRAQISSPCQSAAPP